MRKVLCLLLAVVMMASCVPALAEWNDHTDYVDWPLVKDGSVTVSVYTKRDETYGLNPEDMWFWNFSEQTSGIKFQVEQILSSAIDERKGMMFASNDLRDLMFDIPLTDSEIIRYGMGEGLLLDLKPYITPEIMPNLCDWNRRHPEGLAYATTPDGAIYTLPGYVDLYILSDPGCTIGLQTDYLAEAGYTYGDAPETLDEFVAYLYKIKERHPELYPFGGSYEYGNSLVPMLNAFGFVWAMSGTGAQQGGKGGLGVYAAEMYTGDEKEMVLPIMTERYKEFLTLMHQLYVDGILDPEFFTIGETQVLAGVDNEAFAALGGSGWQYMRDITKLHRWTNSKPLTSQYQTTPRVGTAQKFQHGTVYLSADVTPEKAEMICRYLDFFYSDLGGMYLWCGPASTSADTLGLIGGYIADEKGAASWYDKDGNKIDSQVMMRGHAGGWTTFGNRSNPSEETEAFKNGVTNRPEMRNWFYNKSLVPYGYDPDWGNGWHMRSLKTAQEPYRIDSTPHVVFFDEDTTLEIDDLHLIIDKSVESEVAKFITGKRDLNEWDAFQAELKGMGIETLYNCYLTAYNEYKANLQ